MGVRQWQVGVLGKQVLACGLLAHKRETVVIRYKKKFMATGRDQLCYHGKHRYLSTAELHARHNYYKILFSHINYSLATCKC